MKFFLSFVIFAFNLVSIYSTTIYVGHNEQYKNIQDAASIAKSSDTILVRSGIYSGGMAIKNLRSETDEFINIIGETDSTVIIRGGNNSIQFSDARAIFIKNLIIEGQTGNGMNIDDGSTYDTPTSRVIINNCTFRDMVASGNNDLLKLSGLDTFVIENCIFENGAAGGSGIDMVGCHYGRIEGNSFKNMGSNAIQAKGGTQYLIIQSNFFEDCGERTLNLGGNTGLAYFRPIDAKFEAADISVWSNIIIGSNSPINYVGSVRVEVINNTIIYPKIWVVRILQETVDESRFYKCSQGVFDNNIIYLGNLKTETNIGPNTLPQDFHFANNFWYNYENENWDGPQIPTPDENQIINQNPMFQDIDNHNFKLKSGSKALAYIKGYIDPKYDYYKRKYIGNRSAGAIESATTEITTNDYLSGIALYPNPARDYINIQLSTDTNININIYDIMGIEVLSGILPAGTQIHKLSIENLPIGIYYIKIGDLIKKFVKM